MKRGVTVGLCLDAILGMGGQVDSGVLVAWMMLPFLGTLIEPLGLVGLLGVAASLSSAGCCSSSLSMSTCVP